MLKTAVIFKTHTWNTNIELFVKKIMIDTRSSHIDFYVLIHDEKNSIPRKIKTQEILKHVVTFTQNDITSIYKSGFINMWLSNHWVLMWFWKNIMGIYEYVWSIEYDVRISGSTSLIWNINSDADLIYPIGNYCKPNSTYSNSYEGIDLSDNEKRVGFLQLARYSKKALDYLDSCYSLGINGQDELITFSLMNKSNLIMTNKPIKNLIAGTWTWLNEKSFQNTILYLKYNKDNRLAIFHPVK